MVALRRRLYNARRPPDRLWNDQVRAALPQTVTRRVDAWLDLFDSRERRLRELPGVLEREHGRARSSLREAVGRDRFRVGLVQASPDLYRELREWLAKGDASSVDRSVAIRLMKFLARAVAKTSPFSTFMISGLGEWRRGAGALAHHGEIWSWRTVVEPNLWLAQRAVGLLASTAEGTDRWRLRVNPSVVVAEGGTEMLTAGGSDRVARVQTNQTVRECVRAVGSGEARTPAQLRDHLMRLDEGRADSERVTDFVSRLVASGVLEFEPSIPDQRLDDMEALAALFDGQQGPDAHAVRTSLRSVRTLLREYPESGAETRLGLLDRLRESATALATVDGTPDTGGVLAKNLCHETALFTRPVLTADPDDWAPVVTDLDRVRRFMALFQRNLSFRMAVADFFRDRFGEESRVPVLRLYREVRDAMREPPPGPGGEVGRELGALNEGRVFDPWRSPEGVAPSVREVYRMREEASVRIRDTSVDRSGARELDPEDLERMVASWPEYVRPVGSAACYVQELPGDDRSGVVLNGITVGYDRWASRIRRLLEQAEGSPNAALAGRGPPGNGTIELVEVGGAFGSALNLRAAVTDRELDYPGVGPLRPPERRVAPRDLVVTYDSATGVLELRRDDDGTLVRPLHLGTQAEHLLPSALRFLVSVFGEPSHVLNAGWSPFADPTVWGTDDGGKGPGRMPRVRLGRVVVAREAHYMPAGGVPLRNKGEAEADHLLRVVRWLAEHGLPERCYARVLDIARGRSGAGPDPAKSRKPMFVDFANQLLLAGFERAVGSPEDLVTLHEPLPDPAGAPAYGPPENPANRHVTEYVVEVAGPEVRYG
ncbi:lantibiotic dehydratase [Halostreptopolyspora alba]|uniref:lantibiotic dehydratase n=1 Tax=Halostreptopolyspora alba TaxID=2487137 RepID=UPI0026AC8C4C